MTKYILIACAIFFFLSVSPVTGYSAKAMADDNQTTIGDDNPRALEDMAEIVAVIAAASAAVGLIISIRSDAELLRWYENKKKGKRK
jgi:TRAP-type uncharacterized transport system fused permease subunit